MKTFTDTTSLREAPLPLEQRHEVFERHVHLLLQGLVQRAVSVIAHHPGSPEQIPYSPAGGIGRAGGPGELRGIINSSLIEDSAA
jgi:hypothetical protein